MSHKRELEIKMKTKINSRGKFREWLRNQTILPDNALDTPTFNKIGNYFMKKVNSVSKRVYDYVNKHPAIVGGAMIGTLGFVEAYGFFQSPDTTISNYMEYSRFKEFVGWEIVLGGLSLANKLGYLGFSSSERQARKKSLNPIKEGEENLNPRLNSFSKATPPKGDLLKKIGVGLIIPFTAGNLYFAKPIYADENEFPVEINENEFPINNLRKDPPFYNQPDEPSQIHGTNQKIPPYEKIDTKSRKNESGLSRLGGKIKELNNPQTNSVILFSPIYGRNGEQLNPEAQTYNLKEGRLVPVNLNLEEFKDEKN